MNNLFKIAVSDSISVIYTVGSNENEIIALILDFLDNRELNEIFSGIDFSEEKETVGTTDVK